MDLTSLRIFVEVMRRGSFAAVARDRNVDPSLISRAIAGLEDEIGVRLFQRTTRRLAPTGAGIVYFERIEPLVDELEHARLKAIDSNERPTGTLRIAAHVSFALLNIIPLLPELAERYPELSIDLVLTDATLDLVEERIDVAVRVGPPPAPGLIAQQLAPLVGRVCASPAYLQRHGRPSEPDDLARHNCLLLKLPGVLDRWRFQDLDGRTTEVSVQGRLHTSNAVALKQCALDGMGIILQARWIVGRELRAGTLIDLFPDHTVTLNSFESAAAWLLYPSRTYVPLKVQVFVNLLRQKFKDAPPWDTPSQERRPKR
jgi:DNA-binding transcriptional LysR family regulator